MFCIAFGLSMDYEVFLLSRIKEEYDLTGDNTLSVASGLERTGQIVTAAAATLSIVFIAIATSQVTFIKLFGYRPDPGDRDGRDFDPSHPCARVHAPRGPCELVGARLDAQDTRPFRDLRERSPRSSDPRRNHQRAREVPVDPPTGTTSAPRTRAKRGEGDKLRTEILAAAERLLIETGSKDAVSVRAIADACDCTPPAIYLHFRRQGRALPRGLQHAVPRARWMDRARG